MLFLLCFLYRAYVKNKPINAHINKTIQKVVLNISNGPEIPIDAKDVSLISDEVSNKVKAE